MRTSDKGQYFEAILARGGGLNRAAEIFLHRFWRDRFEEVGATPATTEQRLEDVTNTLKKRLKSGQLDTDQEWERVAKLVLQEARNIKLAPRYIRFDHLEHAHDAYADAYWERYGEDRRDEDWRQDEKGSLQESTQYLVSRRILHQGIDWRCIKCANNNWTSIDSLSRKMICDVCGREQAAPVSFVRNFKLDGFILEGMRDHGVLASIWCLSRLSERSRSSFYYSPSQELFFSEDSYARRKSDAEIDLLAVVDGVSYACEIKSSARQFDKDKFVELAARIRPDTALLAVFDEVTPAFKASFEAARDALASQGVAAELMSPQERDTDGDPRLPSGRSELITLGFG